MKNNTKLIMETWRRFLAEGPDAPMYDPEEGEPSGEPIDPSEEKELSGDVLQKNNMPYDEDYNPGGISDAAIGDPAIQTGPAPMLSDDDPDYDMTDSTYMSDPDEPLTGEPIPDDSGSFDDSLDRYDPMDDMESGLDYDSQSALGDYQDYYNK